MTGEQDASVPWESRVSPPASGRSLRAPQEGAGTPQTKGRRLVGACPVQDRLLPVQGRHGPAVRTPPVRLSGAGCLVLRLLSPKGITSQPLSPTEASSETQGQGR